MPKLIFFLGVHREQLYPLGRFNTSKVRIMKKSITLLALVAALMVAIPSKAQFSWGLKAGLNNTRMSFHHHDWNTSSRSGWFAGLTAKYTIPNFGLGLDLSALYDQREADIIMDYYGGPGRWDTSLKERAISIPINLRYDIDLGSFFGIFIAAGPEFAFNVGSKNQRLYYDDSYWNMKSTRISVNIGLGILLLRHLQVGANYSISCNRTGKTEDWKENWGPDPEHGRSNTWQVSLAYYF